MIRVRQYVVATIPALAILGFFVWFANWIPQTRWEPPQKQEIAAGTAPAELAVVGETIVRERGCMACHTIEPGVGVTGGGRGPNWADIANRRAQGVPGGPANLVDYLTQALYEPSAYLIEEYADIMPAATDAPANLTYEETVAVINYLQSLGGRPSAEVGDIPRPPEEAVVPSEEGLTEPATIFATFKCASCHSLEAEVVRVGPTLDTANLQEAAADRAMTVEAFIMESIVDPAAFEKEEFPTNTMPLDFGTRMTAGQLRTLVEYLLLPGGEQ